MAGTVKPTLLPPENLAGPALSAVTMVMTFLACLALGCFYFGRPRCRPLAGARHQRHKCANY